jgi:hypothetical protein
MRALPILVRLTLNPKPQTLNPKPLKPYRPFGQESINHVGDLEMDWMERRSVAMADHVISPSRYLLGWMARQAGAYGRSRQSST